MTPCIPENFSTWLVDWSLVTGNTMPPRDPNDDDDDDDDEDDDDDDDDEGDDAEARSHPARGRLLGNGLACGPTC